MIKTFGADGEPIRGERRINESQAAIVRSIFNAYASGVSPKAIARQLNKEKVAGPSGKEWGQSTINGNRERGTGILNNELYIGRLVWNRLRYIKDPDTGKRVSRLNPESEWIVQDVPELRIIDQDLWKKVKARQQSLTATASNNGKPRIEERRRARYLFSGLLKCGTCGGGFVKYSHDRLGCATARNKGTCDNLLTIKRPDVEAAVLNGLRHHLMHPEALAIFCEEYTTHLNRIRRDRSALVEGQRAEHAKLTREIDRLIEAIMGGVPGSQVKDKIAAAENRKAELEALLDQAEEEPVRLHPNMAGLYREQVGALCEALDDEERRTEASEIIRSLVDRIILRPVHGDGKEKLAIDLEGHVAGILSLATKGKRPLSKSDPLVRETTLVAGECNQRDLPSDQSPQEAVVAGGCNRLFLLFQSRDILAPVTG